MRISIIVTSNNRAHIITDTINSILNQTYKDFELIIVDNFSNDNTEEIISNFMKNDMRIRYYKNQNNGIVAVNRNFGIKKAKGEYIAFCDDDDLWLPKKLEEQLKHFDDDIIGVGTSSILFGDLSFHRQKTIRKNILFKFDDFLRNGCGVPLSSLMIRNMRHFFDESKSLAFVEDFDFQLSITQKTGKMIKLLSSPLIKYKVQSDNGITYVKKSKNSLNLIKKYENYLSEVQLNNLHSAYYNNIGLRCLRSTTKGGSYYFKKAVKYGSLKGKILSIAGIILSLLPTSFMKVFLKTYYKSRKLLISCATFFISFC